MNAPEEFVNPIDKDKITETPSTLTYAHSVGGAIIKPIDKGRTKGLAVEAMRQQTDMQLAQIKKQVDLLAEQARKIHKRMEVSEKIYEADMSFKPNIGHTYHLYWRADGQRTLSLIAPNEWGRKGCPFEGYEATVKLLSDHTWEILEEGQQDQSY